MDKDFASGLNLEKMQQMLAPKNIANTIRMFIPMGSKELIEGFVEQADLASDGAEFLACAIRSGHLSIVEMFLKKGVKSDNPPLNVTPNPSDKEWHESYRKTSYLIQAAQQGNLEVFQLLIQNGRQIFDVGHICLSRKKKNSVISNVVGAAAYYGHSRLLKYILTKVSASLIDQVNLPALESLDIRPLTSGPLKTEFEGFTPLMLAVVSEKANLDVVKQLLAAQANFNIREKQSGDNILHLAARWCPQLDILEYLIRSLNQDMLFERNLKGDTPLSICITQKNQKAVELLEKLQIAYDKSRQKTGDLLASLDAEAEKAEREKQKRKDKKYRAKLQKLAERDNCSVEETEKRLKAEKEKKANEEQDKIDKQLQKEADEERQRIQEIEERQRRFKLEEERIAREEAEYQRERALQRARKADEKAAEARRFAAEESEANKNTIPSDNLNKKARRQIVQEERRRNLSVSASVNKIESDIEDAAQETERTRSVAPSQERKVPSTPTASNIVGFNGELALKTMSRRTKKKLVDQMNQEALEEKALKERILKAKQEEIEVKKRLEAELYAKEKAEAIAQKKALKAQSEAFAAKKKEAAEVQAQASNRKTAREPVAISTERVRSIAIQPANNLVEETPTPKDTKQIKPAEKPQKQSQAKVIKVYKQKAAPETSAVNLSQVTSTPLVSVTQPVINPAAAPEKQQEKKQERVEKKEKKQEKSENISSNIPQKKEKQFEYQPKAQPVQTPIKSENLPQVSDNQVSKAQYDKLVAQLAEQDQQYKTKLAEVTSQLEKQKQATLRAEGQIRSMADEIENLKQDAILQQAQSQVEQSQTQSISEKELIAQLKSAQENYATQLSVNKVMAGKVLNFEKQLADERRKVQELQRQVPAASSSGSKFESGLSGVQKQLSDLKNRVNNL